MSILRQLLPSANKHGLTQANYDRLIAKIKRLVNVAPIERIGEVLEFNVRLADAFKLKSMRALQYLERDLDNFKI